MSISATGPLQSSIYNVVFSGTGKIAEIDVKVGQTVSQGQILAKLDKTSLQDAYNEAQANVLAAVAALNNAMTTSGKTQAQSQANVAAAQTALNNARKGLTTTQAQSQANIASAQTSLADAQANLLKVEQVSEASIASAQTALTNAQINLRKVQAEAQANINLAYDQEQQAISKCNGNAKCIQLAEDQYNQTVATAHASVATAQGQVDTAQKQLSSAQAQAAANINTAQGQINTAQSQLTAAQAQANTNNTTAQGQISTAQSQLNTTQTQLQTAQHNLNNAILRAPHDGIVTIINGSVGGTPGIPSNSTATVASNSTFIQIVDVSSLQVQANVNESDIGNLKVGQSAQFTVSAYGDRLFHGTVSAISPNGQTVSNVVTYPVTIDVDMSNLQGANLLPGMTANVTITVAQRPNVLLIPVNAVNFARSSTNSNNGQPALITKEEANSAVNQARSMLRQLESENSDITMDNPIPAFVLEQSANGSFIVKPVVLGLTDGTVYVVLKGLSLNETIVVGMQGG